MAALPTEIRTERLLLRPWRGVDADDLHPILVANYEHLAPWIPTRVATPAPVPALTERLSGFAADFAADREWRFAMFTLAHGKLLGEVDLFPRSSSGRVALDQADRAEIGYWLRADETGNGFALEAARALLTVAASVPRFLHAEIRCDARNAPSAAVPHRLGFTLSATIPERAVSPGDPTGELQVWTLDLPALLAVT